MNLLSVFEQGDVVLVATFCLLVALSVYSWTLIVLKACAVVSRRRALARFFSVHITSPNWAERLPNATPSRDVETLVALVNGVEKSKLTHHLEQAVNNMRMEWERGLTPLASIGSSAPFIGLFGTVWGVYLALQGLSKEQMASLQHVAGPMGEALVMTALGLFVAIPAVLAYNLFQRLHREEILKMEHVAKDIAAYHGA